MSEVKSCLHHKNEARIDVDDYCKENGMKPCRICGQLAPIMVDSGSYYTVDCKNCGNTTGFFIKKAQYRKDEKEHETN